MRKPVQFQRRHFEFIAKTIKSLPDHSARVLAALAFIEALPSTNWQFKPDRFAEACGLVLGTC
jgi:hypothetical protein